MRDKLTTPAPQLSYTLYRQQYFFTATSHSKTIFQQRSLRHRNSTYTHFEHDVGIEHTHLPFYLTLQNLLQNYPFTLFGVLITRHSTACL